MRGCRDVDYDVMIYTSDMAPKFPCNRIRIPFVAVAESSYPVLVMPFKTPVMPLCIHIIQPLLFPKLSSPQTHISYPLILLRHPLTSP
jgi:hypothetical protein